MTTKKPERLLRLPEVMHRVGLRRPTIYKKMQAGTFPKQQKRGHASVWLESEIDAWITPPHQEHAA